MFADKLPPSGPPGSRRRTLGSWYCFLVALHATVMPFQTVVGQDAHPLLLPQVAGKSTTADTQWVANHDLLKLVSGLRSGERIALAVPDDHGAAVQATFRLESSDRSGRLRILRPEGDAVLAGSTRIVVTENGHVFARIVNTDGSSRYIRPDFSSSGQTPLAYRLDSATEETAPFAGRFECGDDGSAGDPSSLLEPGHLSFPSVSAGTQPGLSAAILQDTLVVDVVVEVSERATQLFPSPEDARAYTEALLAIVNGIYETEVGIRLDYSRIRLWPPPIEGTNPIVVRSSALETAFSLAAYYEQTQPSEGRGAAIVLMHDVGGAAMEVGSLCSRNRFAAAGLYNLPDLNNWSIAIVAHEIGHVLGAYHTHASLWPQGPQDTCNHNRNQTGTIMSYCDSYRLEFDEYNRKLIRTAVETRSGSAEVCMPGTYTGGYAQTFAMRLSEFGLPLQDVAFGVQPYPGSAIPLGPLSFPSDDQGLAVHSSLPFGVFSPTPPDRYRFVSDVRAYHSDPSIPMVATVGPTVERTATLERGFLVSASFEGVSDEPLYRKLVVLCELLDHANCYPLASDVSANGQRVYFGEDDSEGLHAPILPGAYALYVFSPRYAVGFSEPFLVNVTGDLDLGTIRVTPLGSGTATMLVRAADPMSSGIPQATVVLSGPETRTVTTDDTGVVLIRGLLPGQYTVSAQHPAHTFSSRSVTVAGGIAYWIGVYSSFGPVHKPDPPFALGDKISPDGTRAIHWGWGRWNRTFEYQLSSTPDFSIIEAEGSAHGPNYHVLSTPVNPSWRWRVRARNEGGLSDWAESGFFAMPTDVEGRDQGLPSISVADAYPNPSDALTTFRIRLTTPGAVRLTAWDALGRLVSVLIDDQHFDAGYRDFDWPTADLRSGLYFVRLEASGQRVSRAVIVRH